MKHCVGFFGPDKLSPYSRLTVRRWFLDQFEKAHRDGYCGAVYDGGLGECAILGTDALLDRFPDRALGMGLVVVLPYPRRAGVRNRVLHRALDSAYCVESIAPRRTGDWRTAQLERIAGTLCGRILLVDDGQYCPGLLRARDAAQRHGVETLTLLLGKAGDASTFYGV